MTGNEWINQIHEGDIRTVLDALPASSIHCAVTSPPYYSLRDYGHDDQIGLEPTVSEYIEQLVTVGRKLRRVLRPDGSWWLNLGDSYAGSGGAGGQWTHESSGSAQYRGTAGNATNGPLNESSLTRKCKMLVPHRVALALIDDGWIVRSDAVWAKKNGMPSSVKDRLNETKEFVFHLTPQPDYWFDLDAIREPHAASSIERDDYEYTSAGGQATQCPGEHREQVTLDDEQGLHPNGKNPGDVFDVAVAQCSAAHSAVFPEQLIKPPIKAGCPPHVCAACGTPYIRDTAEEPLTLDGDTVPERPQTCRALALARQADLTDEHLQACRAVGIGDVGTGKHCQTGTGNNDERVERLAAEAKDVLGGYFREFTGARQTTQGWTPQCDCETDETEPGIVLDPFAGAGTTCRVAKRLGRRFVGIEVNPEYVALAQQRAGIGVDEPERLSEDRQLGLTAFTDGGAVDE
jgi:DNA modification methylase